jgi:hypothetical protein
MEASDLHPEISREMNPVPNFLGTLHNIAYLVPLHEASFFPLPCPFSMAAFHTQSSTQSTVIPNPSFL